MIKLKLISILFLLSSGMWASEWQWSVQVKSLVSSETNDYPRAFLWVPTGCRQLKAVVVGNHNMLEEGIFEHSIFRKEMSRLNVGIVWITPGLGPEWDVDKTSGWYQRILDQLAAVSGYDELGKVPVIPVGHSAYATFPWSFAAWNPDKTLAVISLKGDAPRTPLTGYGRKNTDWGQRTIHGIPALMVMSEYEWWEDRITPALKFIENHPEACISFLADVERGHFDVSESLIRYLCLFITKAVKYRITNKDVALKSLDPRKGWLAERWWPACTTRNIPASWESYAGDKSQAFWYFDREMAEATETYYLQSRGREPGRFLGFKVKGQLVDYKPASHDNFRLPFVPEPDGVTFKVRAVQTDSSRNVRIVDGQEPLLERICGPVKQLDDTTFQLSFYRMGTKNGKRSGEIWLLASLPGTKRRKGVVQQARMVIPVGNTLGKPQTIIFDSLPDCSERVRRISLMARSDHQLPVSFYVLEGPAYIEANRLHITKIPPRTAFPVKVTVVAWQYGNAADSIRSAHEVTRSFYIHKVQNNANK